MKLLPQLFFVDYCKIWFNLWFERPKRGGSARVQFMAQKHILAQYYIPALGSVEATLDPVRKLITRGCYCVCEESL